MVLLMWSEEGRQEDEGGDERHQNSKGEEVAKGWGKKGADDAIRVYALGGGLEVVGGCGARHDGTCLGKSGLGCGKRQRMLTCKQMRGD